MSVSVVTAVLAGFTVLNIALSLALIRQIRPLQKLAEELGGAPDKNLPRAGTRVQAFTTDALDGARLTHDGLAAGPALVAVVLPHCPWCERIHARLVAEPPEPPLWVFVYGSADDTLARDVARKFGDVAARVAYVDDGVLRALGMNDETAFPTLLRVNHGVVRAAGHRLMEVLPYSNSRRDRP